MKNTEHFLSEIYFHELESREKIFNRLQLNFVIYTTIFAILAYMARMIDYDSNCKILTLFYVGLLFSIVLSSISIYFSVISLSNNKYKYMLFSKATEVVEYKAKLEISAKEIEKYNKEYNSSHEIPIPQDITDKFTVKTIAKCIDHNADINESRRLGIRKAIWYMILASVPIIFSASLFVIFDLDTSSPRKNHLVEDKKLAIGITKLDDSLRKFQTTNIEKERITMSDNKTIQNDQVKNTPPPPPPSLPPEPSVQYSTEDFKMPMTDKRELLQEKNK